MSYIESTLRAHYAEDRLHILSAKGNSGSFTYDGIELGAERVTQEIETFLEDLERRGRQVEKLSIVGYSLGGLVARYVIGLLYSNGWLSKIQPVNFTTFATPHLGVRTPILGVHSHFWNILGSRTISTSGRQLFMIDSFRDSKRPILSVLADPNSIFIQALLKFKNRVLYANITNDRSAPYYTTSISRTDPFKNLDKLDINYLPAYSPIILDPSASFSSKNLSPSQPLYTRLTTTGQNLVNGLPFAVLMPVGVVVFLVVAGFQSVRSQQRIRLHESGGAGISLGSYRIPLMIENARNAVGGAIENLTPNHEDDEAEEEQEQANHSKNERNAVGGAIENLTPNHDNNEAEQEQEQANHPQNYHPTKDLYNNEKAPYPPNPLKNPSPSTPTLALTPTQFAMIDHLNAVGFRKYRVHIHNVKHSHAAIIVRSDTPRFDEGKVVVRHWLEKEFEI